MATTSAGILAAFASPVGEPLATTTAPGTRSTPATDREGRLRAADPDPLTGASRERDAPTR